ncbi:bifunctional hydroxymethylpyrimidine kinase/phosphomethylpyrimidine kinase [Ideonella sp.]|jgi:hydroxymethylpyrimidine kinase/phosphomethylpyrimidine kinase/thiamine-phosphate diphosphorylase|uniref:bifunctional hydroxymethylpyrimidine kinase/phosphomethylpyrimidine kinase n=1 Tax=Ideonella sp. TaxID=1929293 RepID=UPI0037BF4A66
MRTDQTLPIVWSISGHDSGGGAGLSADQRAAEAMGVHLCPVLSCVTAQNSLGVQALHPVPLEQLEAQLCALAEDMPPNAIKTGLLASTAAISLVARWVSKLRERKPRLPLVVDPVLGATAGGAAFSDEAILEAYRGQLLPLATLVTPNQAEARRLLERSAAHGGGASQAPQWAADLRGLGAASAVITGGDDQNPDWALDWLDTPPHAQGWLSLPRIPTPHHHGSGCTFATAAAAALALGHVAADAVVLAKMLTAQALSHASAAGQGAGPVRASPGQPLGPIPLLGLGQALPWQVSHSQGAHRPLFMPFETPHDGLYGILADSQQLLAARRAGLSCLQLRYKSGPKLLDHIAASVSASAQPGTQLFINDHWQQVLALKGLHAARPGKWGLHLGQEDLLALDEAARAHLLSARHHLMLGVSSHSVWELARAAGCGASLIACGPVQATTTKDMPWRPQGEHNLRWWVAHSPAPVVAIGGILEAADVQRFAACGPAAVGVVRGLGNTEADMRQRLPPLRDAFAQAQRHLHAAPHAVFLPQPVL